MSEVSNDHIHTLAHNGVTWVCVERPTAANFELLVSVYNLHPVHLRESTQTVQLTQVERETDYIFLLVHLPTYNAKTDRIQTSQVGVFLGKDFVVTVHDGKKSAITDLFLDCQADDVIADTCFKQSSGFLLYSILKQLMADLSDTVENLLNELDAVEVVVFDNSKSDAYQIGKLRQKITRMKRVIDPLQSVLRDLAEQINDFSHANLSKDYFNNAKLANKLTEVIAEAQETIEIFKDADFTTSTEQTNRILAILTLVFTFTIPVTVLGTIYGMNVPLPGGLSSGVWTFFGPYTTAGLIVFVSSAAALSMYVFFKQKRWF